jgi:hypothetical protein
MVRRSEGTAEFVPEEGGPVLEVSERVERRFLGRTVIARFRTVVPARDWGPGRASVIHTGRLRRQGIEVRDEYGSDEAAELVETLGNDAEFVRSATQLDFTRFELSLDGEVCIADVELMGASLVAIAFPPIRSYVRLHRDQREALIGTLTALERVTAH